MDRVAWWDTGLWGHKDLDMTKHTHTHTHMEFKIHLVIKQTL